MTTVALAMVLMEDFEVGAAVVAGLVGAIAMLPVIYAGLMSGMTSMNLLKTLGTMVAPSAPNSTVYGIGLMMHLMVGAGSGLVHAGLLHAVDPASDGGAAAYGALFGGVHGMLVALSLPMMLTMMHPLVKSGDIPAPGKAMTGLGKMTPMGIIMGHIVFGVVAGAVYVALAG